ncbi:hypothetical protein [Sphingomonas sp. Leaf22]|nr:hypothetical protein [Sphingomonas sp. Leaf22]
MKQRGENRHQRVSTAIAAIKVEVLRRARTGIEAQRGLVARRLRV